MIKRPRFYRLAATVLVSAIAPMAGADFAIDWFTIDGGGATSVSGTAFELTGTIGQPDATVVSMSGGEFELVRGFWAVGFAPAPCPADIDGDGVVGQADLGILLASYGSYPGDPGYVAAAGALGGDACADQSDLGVLLAVYGSACL